MKNGNISRTSYWKGSIDSKAARKTFRANIGVNFSLPFKNIKGFTKKK
jgi:hypothetical protein